MQKVFVQKAAVEFTAELQHGMRKPMTKTPPTGQPMTPQMVAAASMSLDVKCDAVNDSPIVSQPNENTFARIMQNTMHTAEAKD